ncbi:hypothetical protein FLJC2902T_28940 [Flavobacterium limnosediminis JC2902]|uniref:Uncharacterized protein n=1 Tax=Flavobacterium limnosediminis JC2902 TaxID=1341181 RepID=V6SJG9_9FLAO|nr:hypothetical protein FLJC2902T_28940 [Flavobacterium limnosediminis JC2902]
MKVISFSHVFFLQEIRILQFYFLKYGELTPGLSSVIAGCLFCQKILYLKKF